MGALLSGGMTGNDVDLAGKVVLVTGSTSGLGLHAARVFHKRGATVILTCRDHIKGRQAVDEILHPGEKGPEKRSEESNEDSQTSRIHLFELDLTDYRSVLQFAAEVKQEVTSIDILVCNAGVMGGPFELSSDGIEMHLASNHFGHFVLVNQLLPLLSAASHSRIIVITSGLYKGASELPPIQQLMGEATWDYDSRRAYAISKLSNCLYVKALARRLEEQPGRVGVFAVRPGFVRGTELGRRTHWLLRRLAAPVIWLFARNIDQGIKGYLHTATAPLEELHSGSLYFDNSEEPFMESVNERTSEELWQMSMRMEELVVKRRNALTDLERKLSEEGRSRVNLSLSA